MVEQANGLIYAEEKILQTKWLEVGQTTEVENPNNHIISQTLEQIINPALVKFLSERHAHKLQQDSPQQYPFVLVIDEAAYLHSSNYMRV